MTRPTFAKPRALSLFALLLLGAASLAVIPSHAEDANKAAPRAALTVNTVKPTTEAWSTSTQVSGSLAPWQEASISSEIGGLRIVQVMADVGSAVKRGQVLVQLSQDTVLADLRRQEALVAQSKAARNEALANAERARSIKESGALSAQQTNQYLVAEETARASLAAATAQLEAERIRLQQTKIVAPDDGIISKREAVLGSVVSTGSEMFRMVRQGRIEWRAEVSAQQLPNVQVGQRAQVTLPNGEIIEGKVRMIAPTLNENTRNALVYVDLPKGAARSGMFASGQILTGERTALAVPQSSVILRDGTSYVYEVTPDSHVKLRRVSTGRHKGDKVEIINGLTAKANVVLSGGAFLNDGDLVKVAQSPQ